MPYLPSLPEDAKLLDVFRAFPASAAPLLELHEALMRGPSPLSAGERELIAAYVSALNACAYCAGVHGATAAAFGLDVGFLQSMTEDLEAAPVDAKLRPLLRVVAKLTRTPSRMAPQHAEAVLAAGWPEQALYDAVAICALYSYMNRLVEGLGIRAEADYVAAAGQRLHDSGYAAMIAMLGLASGR
jgi:uncharacterized peroxidase-related enzyme